MNYNNRTMWRRVAILLIFCGYAGAVFIPRSDLENKPALAITSDSGYIAVATQSKIFVFTNDETRRTAGHVNLDYRSRQKFLELKMFSKSEIFYCDETQCGLCTYSGNDSSCSKIQISKTEKENILDIRSASVLRDTEHFILCLSYMDRDSVVRLVFLKYVAQDNGNPYPIATAWEPPFMSDPVVLHSFQKDNFLYFVVTTTQFFEPDYVLSSRYGNNVTVTKIVQICAHDKTEDLASKISILVGCDREYSDIYSKGEAAFYDDKSKQLDIMMHGKNTHNHTMCRFKLSSIQKKINETWETCQKTDSVDLDTLARSCKIHKTFEKMRKQNECMIFTRMVDSFETTLCSKFGREGSYENCNLHELESTSYRNGWLENYDVLQGELMMQIPATENVALINDLSIDSKSYFMTTGERLIRFTATNSSIFHKLWQTSTASPNKFATTALSDSQIVYPISQGVEKLDVTCQNLYKTCEDLMNGGWNDPLKCAWCATQQPFYTISQVENNEKCTTTLTDHCPPEVIDTFLYTNRTGITIHGDNFGAVKNLTLDVCNTQCHVVFLNDRSIKCSTSESEKLPSDCSSFQLSGLIGSTKYTLPYALMHSDSEVQTEEITGDHNKAASPTWKIALTVLSILGLIVLVAVLVYCMRNRLTQIKPAIRPPRNDRIENDYHLEYIASPRTSHLSSNGDQYVKIFRDLPFSLKIDYSCLNIDKLNILGEGQFGKVYRAEHTDPKTEESETVVCKEIKEGRISEFYEEARTMASFNHINVVRLVGVALEDVTHEPLLVMEYMPHGDLLTYLKDKDSYITMRTMFLWAIDIAEGMAHIHSKQFVHRDLAARNIMLDRNLKAKIADFGLCRKLNQQSQTYEGTGRKLPVLYYPPEVFNEIQFTVSSDCWSFGVLLWEIFSRDHIPFDKMDHQLMLVWLNESENNRLARPYHCPENVYREAILPCWRSDPNRRPLFHEMIVIIKKILKFMEEKERDVLHAGYERISIPSRTTNSVTSSEIQIHQ